MTDEALPSALADLPSLFKTEPREGGGYLVASGTRAWQVDRMPDGRWIVRPRIVGEWAREEWCTTCMDDRDAVGVALISSEETAFRAAWHLQP